MLLSKKWHFCVRETFKRITTFNCSDYGSSFKLNQALQQYDQDHSVYLIDDFKILKSILSRCTNIKTLNLQGINVNSNQSFDVHC